MKSSDALMAVAILFLVGTSHSENPCKTMRCTAGKMCVSVSQPCEAPPCARVGACIDSGVISPVLCPKLRCQACPLGLLRKYDSAGCETCQCYDPCEGVKCEETQECVAKEEDGCARAVCVPMLLCYGHGDPHYHTFDEGVIHYQGIGWFLMSGRSLLNNCQHLKDFELYVEQELRPGWPTTVAFVKTIELVVFPNLIPTSVTIKRFGVVVVSPLPYPPMPAGIESINNGYIVTTLGIVVRYDGHSWASIWIPLAYRHCVTGICGNADGNSQNDYETKEGTNVARKPWNERFWLIGNSYRKGGQTSHEQTKDSVNLQCSRSKKRRFNNIAYCGSLKMTRGPFAKCIAKMPTEAKNAYESCIYDVCVSRNQKKAACDSLQAFAAACEHNGVVSNWRIRTGCRCPGDLKWSRCGRKCDATRTCSNRNVKCGFRCIRKCECSRRTPYQQGDSCLSFPQCRAAGLL